MPVKPYMDHHVYRATTNSLRARGIDVLTAFEDGTHKLDDDKLLDRALELERVLFTNDDDHLSGAKKRQENNDPFYGIIFIHRNKVDIGKCTEDLETILKGGDLEDFSSQIIFICE